MSRVQSQATQSCRFEQATTSHEIERLRTWVVITGNPQSNPCSDGGWMLSPQTQWLSFACPPPPFPLDDEGKLRTPEYPTTQREPPQNIHDDAEEQWEDFDGAPPIVYPREQLPWDLITNVPHWTVPKEDQTASTATGGPPAERSQFVFGGRLIVRISERGFMSLYKLSDP